MAVLINMKICDNADVCSGIEVCPTEAIYWNTEKRTLETDNDKCTSCGLCESSCPAGAIIVTNSEDEFNRYKKRIEEDPRTIAGLFVERYGASPVDESLQVSIKKANEVIKNSINTVAIEVIDDEDTDCLINSVPIADILGKDLYIYHKVSVNDVDYSQFAESYNVNKVPSLLLFSKQSVVYKTDGPINNNNQEEREAFINSVKNSI